MHQPRTLIFCFLSSLLLLCGCADSAPKILSRTGFYFNTIIQITVYDTDSAHAEEVLTQCFSLAQKYESMLSRTVEGSDIWRINHAAGSGVTVSEETFQLLQTALEYADMTDGAVDPTIASLSALWNFSENNASQGSSYIPSDSDIQAALAHTDYRQLTLDPATRSVTLTDPEASLDLGFIAKGFIADQMRALLLSCHIEHALIDLGGNILAVGAKPDAAGSLTPFRIGIRKPFSEEGETLLVLPVTDQSLVSSGNYERYFEKDGVLYHHILDISTGYPIQNHLLQVTILSDSSLTGDALSTTCYILGLEKGMQLIERTPHVEAIFVTDDYQLHYSSGITPQQD